MLSMQQLVVGIFRNHAQAEQAINELHQVGFDHRHIRFAKHGISIGGTLKKIKSLFRGQNIETDGIYKDLVNMGMPPEDARYYQREFEAGRSIVAVLKSGVPLVATSILIRNGGCIVNEHFAQPTDNNQETSEPARIYVHFLKGLLRFTQTMINRYLLASEPGVEEPPTGNANAKLNSANAPIAPSADNGQDTRVEEPPTGNANAKLNSANAPIAPFSDHNKGDETQKIRKVLVKA